MFVITPLPAGEVDADDGVAKRQAADSPLPCRRCLRNAEIGDPLVLTSYNPFGLTSPYAGDGPVFVHEHACEPFEPVPDVVSEQVNGRVLALRAYDGDAMMTDAAVLPGERFEQGVAELFDDVRVAFLHVHFAGPGCFAFRVDRA